MPDLKLLMRRLIAGWKNEDIPILRGVDDITIQNFESKYGVKLPEDMREYFSTVNGMGGHYDEEWFFRLWPIEELQPVKEYAPKFADKFPQSANYFLFFDHSVDLTMCAIGLSYSAATQTPIFEVCDFEQDPRFRYLCKSFTEFVEMYVSDPSQIL
jgi:hypothetical protein